MSEVASFFGEEDSRRGSEFGGVDGIIQPPPHDPGSDASESNSLLMAQDRDDITEWLESKRPAE